MGRDYTWGITLNLRFVLWDILTSCTYREGCKKTERTRTTRSSQSVWGNQIDSTFDGTKVRGTRTDSTFVRTRVWGNQTDSASDGTRDRENQSDWTFDGTRVRENQINRISDGTRVLENQFDWTFDGIGVRENQSDWTGDGSSDKEVDRSSRRRQSKIPIFSQHPIALENMNNHKHFFLF